MTTKKAQGMSMTTIVIAAIALLVLVVLIMIFTGRIGGFTKGLDSCTGQGGFCVVPLAAQGNNKATLDGIILDVNGDGNYTEPEDYRTISGTGCPVLKNVCIKGMRS
jgi:hypothetical protein